MGAGASSAGYASAIDATSQADVHAYLATLPRDERKRLEGCFSSLAACPEAAADAQATSVMKEDAAEVSPAETSDRVTSAKEGVVTDCAKLSEQEAAETGAMEDSVVQSGASVDADPSTQSRAAETSPSVVQTGSDALEAAKPDADLSVAAGCAADALGGVKLELNGKQMQYIAHRPLEADRVKVMSDHFPACKDADEVFAIETRNEDGGKSELVAVIRDGSGVLLKDTCLISFVELSPSESVEYAFAEAPDEWAIAKLSKDALESYRACKFGQWKDLLLKGECEAQLRRMLKAGVVSRIYDEHVFPTPEQYRSTYQVRCEKTGQLVSIPHPVSCLRIWDTASASYMPIDPQLTGAPMDSDKDTYWAELFADIKKTRGEDYIENLVAEEPSAA